MKLVEGRELQKLNWKLQAQNEYNYENNILETLWKLHINQSQELQVNN